LGWRKSIIFSFFRNFKFFLLLFASEIFSIEAQRSMKSVKCESVSDLGYGSIGTLKTCYLNSATSIYDEDYKISSTVDNTIRALNYGHNKKIFFLPESPCDILRNLKVIAGWKCSLKSIEYKNFRKLVNVKYIDLAGNQIETIHSDTFKDLAALEILVLSKKIAG
jgi:Leucine-rich repeat (LRR) protein